MRPAWSAIRNTLARVLRGRRRRAHDFARDRRDAGESCRLHLAHRLGGKALPPTGGDAPMGRVGHARLAAQNHACRRLQSAAARDRYWREAKPMGTGSATLMQGSPVAERDRVRNQYRIIVQSLLSPHNGIGKCSAQCSRRACGRRECVPPGRVAFRPRRHEGSHGRFLSWLRRADRK